MLEALGDLALALNFVTRGVKLYRAAARDTEHRPKMLQTCVRHVLRHVSLVVVMLEVSRGRLRLLLGTHSNGH